VYSSINGKCVVGRADHTRHPWRPCTSPHASARW
jgi:hypothetical protein